MTAPDSPVRILVTGAAGFIGSHTVDQLLALNAQVLGIDDLSTGHLRNLADARKSSNFSFVEGDLADAEAFDSQVAGFRPQAIIHLAALVSVPAGEEDPMKNFRLNVVATQNVAEAARRHWVKRIVFASSAAVYGNADSLPLKEDITTIPVSQYGTAKLMSEKLLAAYACSYGMSAICFRFFNVYGPRQDPSSPYSGVVSIFANRYRAGKPVTIFGDGEQSRDFIYVGDIARGNAAAALDLSLPDGIYNRCTGKAQSLLDLVHVLHRLYPGVPEATHGPERAGDIKHSLGSPEAAVTRLGLEARVPFDEGIAKLLESLS
jgi:UDP-glucose 4-epimerase